jgi:hypothetical protein
MPTVLRHPHQLVDDLQVGRLQVMVVDMRWTKIGLHGKAVEVCLVKDARLSWCCPISTLLGLHANAILL